MISYKNKKILALAIISISIMGMFLLIDNKEEKEEKVEHSPIENIPLYYEIDEPYKTYTRDDKGGFIEIEIDGNS